MTCPFFCGTISLLNDILNKAQKVKILHLLDKKTGFFLINNGIIYKKSGVRQ